MRETETQTQTPVSEPSDTNQTEQTTVVATNRQDNLTLSLEKALATIAQFFLPSNDVTPPTGRIDPGNESNSLEQFFAENGNKFVKEIKRDDVIQEIQILRHLSGQKTSLT